MNNPVPRVGFSQWGRTGIKGPCCLLLITRRSRWAYVLITRKSGYPILSAVAVHLRLSHIPNELDGTYKHAHTNAQWSSWLLPLCLLFRVMWCVMLRPKAFLGIIPPHSSMPTHSRYSRVKSEGIWKLSRASIVCGLQNRNPQNLSLFYTLFCFL